MKKFNTLEETLDYLKSLDDFNIVSKFKICEDCVYAEDEDQLSIIHLFDRRLIERFEVTEHVEKVVRDHTAVQNVSDVLTDYLDSNDVISFSINRDNTIHVKFTDDHVLLVEVFYLDRHLELEVTSKYRLEIDNFDERISLSTRDRIDLEDLIETIKTFDQRANRLIEASKDLIASTEMNANYENYRSIN